VLAKIEGQQLHGPHTTMDELYDELEMCQRLLRRAETEYHGYVKKAAWSDEICSRVDYLKWQIKDLNAAVADLKMSIRFAAL
jgi:hypothetical protein